jgi:hypothetical protein
MFKDINVHLVRIIVAISVCCIVTIVFQVFKFDSVSFTNFIPIYGLALMVVSKEFHSYTVLKSKVMQGIGMLKDNKKWSVNNIIVSVDEEDADILNIRNDLFWAERVVKKLKKNNNNYIDTIEKEFEEIKKIKVKDNFIREKKVRYYIYNKDKLVVSKED